MKDPAVLYHKDDTIGILTFNRPDNRNSMNQETLTEFTICINKIKKDKTLRCLIITGSGTTFCGGADLKNSIVGDGSVLSPDMLMDFYRPFLEIGQLKMPVIAAINGHAIGGGFGLSLLCDIRIAYRKARLGANFTRLGIHSGMAVSYILPRLVGVARACELLFTGKIITGETAALMGLVNDVVDADAVMNDALKLAKDIAISAPAAVQMMKQSIYRGLDWQPIRAAELEALNQSHTFGMEDSKEGIAAVLEKRNPEFKGK